MEQPHVVEPEPNNPPGTDDVLPETEPTQENLREDILEILGKPPTQGPREGPKLHDAITSRWTNILKNGLEEDTRQEVLKNHLLPENLVALKVPKLNPEVMKAISPLVLRRDEKLASKQERLNTSISAIGQVLSLILAEQGGGNNQYVKLLSDAGRLLCDFHHTEKVTRRELITINLNKDLKDTLSDSPVDQFLFGETLDDRVKSAKNLEKSSLDYKPAKPKPFKKPAPPLNSRGPARYVKGARVGQQYEKVLPLHRQANYHQKSERRDLQTKRQQKEFRRDVPRPQMGRQPHRQY